jgi:hypothetical protein
MLALERLEPRQLLAADGLAVIEFVDAAGQSGGAVVEGPAALPVSDWSPDAGRDSSAQQSSAQQHRAAALEEIDLEQVADELGELIVWEVDDYWWCEDGWHDTDAV